MERCPKALGRQSYMGTHLKAVVTSSEDEQSPDIQKESAEESEIKKEAKEVKPKKKSNDGEEVALRVSLPYKPKGEMFAVAETFQGGSRLQVICEDGRNYFSHKYMAIRSILCEQPTRTAGTSSQV